MDLLQWRDSPKTVKNSRKRYAHFDCHTDILKSWNYISNPGKVATHGFYPFIHYEKKMTKYNKKKGRRPKVRDICYAAHIDRCIFQYYSFLLNQLYNRRLYQDGLSDVAVAYRNDLKSSNIEFAKRAFDFIKRHSPCYVMIGDFTGFFDNLNHRYLKERWCDLLGESRLPKDHFAVFKNITHYSRWELKDLLELNHLPDTRAGRKSLNNLPRVLTPEQFKKYKSHIIEHTLPYGIPQGSPISALLANVYMLKVDKAINDFITQLNGFYMRYSDDFIIVLPETNAITADAFPVIMDTFNKTVGLTLEPQKTQFFKYDENVIINSGLQFYPVADCKHRFINFLGFTFDGEKISIRSKTISKYYYRMRRKAKTIRVRRGYSPKGKHISCHELYRLYSVRGAHANNGNFITYVERAERIFGPNEVIGKDTKRHMQKIRQALTPMQKNHNISKNNSTNV